MKKIEIRELENMGATTRQIQAYWPTPARTTKRKKETAPRKGPFLLEQTITPHHFSIQQHSPRRER